MLNNWDILQELLALLNDCSNILKSRQTLELLILVMTLQRTRKFRSSFNLAVSFSLHHCDIFSSQQDKDKYLILSKNFK